MVDWVQQNRVGFFGVWRMARRKPSVIGELMMYLGCFFPHNGILLQMAYLAELEE